MGPAAEPNFVDTVEHEVIEVDVPGDEDGDPPESSLDTPIPTNVACHPSLSLAQAAGVDTVPYEGRKTPFFNPHSVSVGWQELSSPFPASCAAQSVMDPGVPRDLTGAFSSAFIGDFHWLPQSIAPVVQDMTPCKPSCYALRVDRC